ncbi:MAG: thiol-disulfide isomerase/thioredoxin [Parvicellaceae bacterium]|jgi:thiol-disulfide isomerase/thioredoxin
MSCLKSYSLLLFALIGFASCETTTEEIEIADPLESAQNDSEGALKNGDWIGKLNLPSGNYIPFNFTVNGTSLVISNSSEKIETKLDQMDDSIHFKMPAFDSEFKFMLTDDSHLAGYWINYAKTNYRIPFTAEITSTPNQRFNHAVNNSSANFDGKWETTFGVNNDPEKAIGVFEQTGNTATGTFLTETGDYRYLQGNIINDSLYLSCFDGSHAFLFKAVKSGDSLKGEFYSGKHYTDDLWTATLNPEFELTHPDSLTYLIDPDQPFRFAFPGVNADSIKYPSNDYNGKVVIVQVFGSWCPNCKDESLFYNDLYTEFKNEGLDIIGLGFERPESLDGKKARIRDFMEALDVEYEMAVGGSSGKAEAKEALPQLNQVISFPTSVFIDRSGKVRKIHTGFYGPGTGAYYDNYKERITIFLKDLLQEEA